MKVTVSYIYFDRVRMATYYLWCNSTVVKL